jgi:AMIN domain
MKLTIKLTFKITTGILATALMVGGLAATNAVAQNLDAIDNARSTAKSLQQKQANSAPASAPATAKPAPGAPAPAVKPAAIPGSKPVASASSSSSNQLERVKVVPGASSIQIEISSSQAVTPRVSKLSSPARVLVELPETVDASAQNKISVGSAGVKGVRIGMDGKTPPTTSVVVDLDSPLAYELTPGSAGKLILTLHSASAPAVAKSTPAPAPKAEPVKTLAVKAEPIKAQPIKTASVQTASVKADPVKTAPVKVAAVAIPAVAAPKVVAVKASAEKPAAQASQLDPKEAVKAAVAAKTATVSTSQEDLAKSSKPDAAKPKPEEKKWSLTGKRDPFFSPVVQTNGSGCSTGKKCLEIGAINLRGVVKSDTGFIAVVTNSLNKAYFLRENDPVFNGFVVKITGDSVVFRETIQDKLGKSFTREVVKRIFTPAV